MSDERVRIQRLCGPFDDHDIASRAQGGLCHVAGDSARLTRRRRRDQPPSRHTNRATAARDRVSQTSGRRWATHAWTSRASRSRASGLRALSAVEHRPADVVRNRWRRVRARESPPGAGRAATGTESPCALALSFRRCSTCGLDRIGGRTELVRGDVCDGCGLAGSVSGMPRCPLRSLAAAIAWPPAVRAWTS